MLLIKSSLPSVPRVPMPKYTHPAQAAWWLTGGVLESRNSTLVTQENAKCLKTSNVRPKLGERQEFGYTYLPGASYQLMTPARSPTAFWLHPSEVPLLPLKEQGGPLFSKSASSQHSRAPRIFYVTVHLLIT